MEKVVRSQTDEQFQDLGELEEEVAELEYGLVAKRHSDKRIFVVMLIAAVASLVAAFVLSVDAIKLAADPSISLSCDFNAVLSCGTVGTSWQASAFGFPNAFLGLMFEPMVITMALMGLSGVRLPRWLAVTEQVIYLFAFGFAVWLFYQSMFVIGALCPWCLVITYATAFVFLSLLHYNIKYNNFCGPGKTQDALRKFIRNDGDLYVGIGWVVLVTALIIIKYGPAIIA